MTVTDTPTAQLVKPPVTPLTGGNHVGSGNNVYDYNDFRDYNPAYTDSSSIYSSCSAIYQAKTFTYSKTVVSVKGSYAPNAQIVVEKIANQNAIFRFYISIDGGYTG